MYKNIKKIKIKNCKDPSGEITNIKLLREINKTRMRVILSTGMSNIREIKFALKVLEIVKLKYFIVFQNIQLSKLIYQL